MTRQVDYDTPHRRSEDHSSRDCAYQTGSMRCRYPGSISDGTTGQGPWFCRSHARDRGSMIASQVLRASQTWFVNPPVDDTSWFDENLPRQAGETQHDYNFRCRDHALSMLKGFRPKPVLDTQPKRMREPGEDAVEL